MKTISSGASVGESLTGNPVGLANEGKGLYAPMEQTNCELQRDLEVIHERLAMRRVFPYRIEPGRKPYQVCPISWGKIR